MERESLGSRMGFILLSAGCAIGIGNVWKFPYMVGSYGGGIFVLFYLFFLVIMGVPVLTMEFEDMTVLRGLSLLPGDDEREYARSPEVSVSVDGENWTILRLTVTGLFDLSFPETETKWLRIRNTEPADVRWSIREIYFY